MGTRGTTLIGQRFGQQVVTRALNNGKVEIRCDCGTVKATQIQYLLSGESRSCGCGRYQDRVAPISVGDVFERLTVTQKLGTTGRKRQVLALCSCKTYKVFYEQDLRSGTTRSCGCLRRERGLTLTKTHGDAGKNRTPMYQRWISLRERIANPDRYPSYVGIEIHSAWRDDFSAFRDYVDANLGECPKGSSLDRKDNDLGYEPGNLRWATAKEQARNRSSNIRVTVDGVTRCLAEWADVSKLTPLVISARRRNGWPDHLAVTLPLGSRRPV